MELFLDILKITIPALITFLAVYLVLTKFLDNEQKKRVFEFRKENQKVLTPVRIQAYERLVLYLERISPSSLTQRVHRPGMSAKSMQIEMIKAIRSEYEHNLSQQLFISNESWYLLKQGKEELIKIINIAAAQLKDSADGIALTQSIYKVINDTKAKPIEKALVALNKEVQRLF